MRLILSDTKELIRSMVGICGVKGFNSHSRSATGEGGEGQPVRGDLYLQQGKERCFDS